LRRDHDATPEALIVVGSDGGIAALAEMLREVVIALVPAPSISV
jgi:hypothetical protein